MSPDTAAAANVSSSPSGPPAPQAAITAADLRAAAARLDGHARVTPVLSDPAIDAAAGGRVLIKAECLQVTGSFKFRGAWNSLCALPTAVRARGVIAFSSGNHGQAVAQAARRLGVPAVVVMPADAPAIKIALTREAGAELVLYDRATQDREAIATAILAERPLTLVKPFDAPLTIAGQATAGLEAARHCAALGIVPDLVLCPVSGGGLLAGVTFALRQSFPRIAAVGVEPTGHSDLAASLTAGRPVALDRGGAPPPASLADALLAPSPGALPLATLQALGGTVTAAAVADEDALAAMALMMRHLKIVAEPGGAVALAACMTGAVALAGRTALVLVSGGNVDPAVIARALAT